MTRRRLNWKVLLITLVLGGALGGALTGLHAWQLNRTAKGLLVLASAQEQASEWMKATEYLIDICVCGRTMRRREFAWL